MGTLREPRGKPAQAMIPFRPSSHTDASHRDGNKPAATIPDRQTPAGSPRWSPEESGATWRRNAASGDPTTFPGCNANRYGFWNTETTEKILEHGNTRNNTESLMWE
jgi:hypothetical protein